ncbi:hypothetical protein ABCR94_33385 [Streptomyces sp. 21So2-11]|uniref:hypothetical protein n=1 Tax=Streptomyces sp. 21So2-11 TaxID=3144408 RepID=UPI00321C2607
MRSLGGLPSGDEGSEGGLLLTTASLLLEGVSDLLGAVTITLDQDWPSPGWLVPTNRDDAFPVLVTLHSQIRVAVENFPGLQLASNQSSELLGRDVTTLNRASLDSSQVLPLHDNPRQPCLVIEGYAPTIRLTTE